MKPEAQRIAIAEACPDLFWVYHSPTESPVSLRPARGRVFRLGEHPAEGDKECDPLNDLNAMHEAEIILRKRQHAAGHDMINQDYGCWSRYVGLLKSNLTFYGSDISSTAAQRAEAFLRTIGKWTEK